jgi:hypothetical protein
LLAAAEEGLEEQHADAAQQDYSQRGFNVQVKHVFIGAASQMICT